MHWQLNKIQYPVYNLGPGARIGIWVQGCKLHCKGCINPETWNPYHGKAISIPELFLFCKNRADDYNGITITGGEPFDQYAQLMAFAMMIKKNTNFNILVYSGYTLDELTQRHTDKAFYHYLDYLIDGRFENNNPCDNTIKGSANQNTYAFTHSKVKKMALCNDGKKWSICCSDDAIYMAGIPKR